MNNIQSPRYIQTETLRDSVDTGMDTARLDTGYPLLHRLLQQDGALGNPVNTCAHARVVGNCGIAWGCF
jgi:hypothetical protein